MGNGKLIQRYGGHLVLVTLAILLIVGSQVIDLGDVLALENAREPAAAVSQQRLVPSETQFAADAGSAQPTPEFDVSELPVITDNGLSPELVPVTYKPKKPQHDLITYTVQSGDTAIRIAEQFGINEETILGGNAFLSNDAGQLMAGTTITILPVDGVLHEVVEGDTVEGLAEQYEVPVEDIINYEPNNLEFPYRLYPGTQILVPGAVREVFYWDPPSMVASSSYSGAPSEVTVAIPGTGTFVWPVGGRRITQYHWYGHQAIDVGLVTGSPVYASDTGTVTYAAWSPHCYGNLIVINHGNGFETFYAHLDGFNVSPGQTVYQGNLIGWSGNTGCSSGPHIHFEIRYNKVRDNPLNYLP